MDPENGCAEEEKPPTGEKPLPEKKSPREEQADHASGLWGNLRFNAWKEWPRWARLLLLGLVLYLFFVSVSFMSQSFLLLGGDLARSLLSATYNPLLDLMLGILVTTLVQSSSVTTTVTVGLVSAGAIDLSAAVFIIMGANIGTSVTNTIVSLGHINDDEQFERAFAGATVHDFFNLLTVTLLAPLELATGFLARTGEWLAREFAGSASVPLVSPLQIITKPAVTLLQRLFLSISGEPGLWSGVALILLSLLFLFASLVLIVGLIRTLALERAKEALERVVGRHVSFGLFVGFGVTALLQSSSLTLSMLVPLAGSATLSLRGVFALTLGANVGTTVTALIAALAGTPGGLAIAFVHLLFNLCGVLLFTLVPFVRRLPLALACWLARQACRYKALALAYLLCGFYLLPLLALGLARFLQAKYFFV